MVRAHCAHSKVTQAVGVKNNNNKIIDIVWQYAEKLFLLCDFIFDISVFSCYLYFSHHNTNIWTQLFRNTIKRTYSPTITYIEIKRNTLKSWWLIIVVDYRRWDADWNGFQLFGVPLGFQSEISYAEWITVLLLYAQVHGRMIIIVVAVSCGCSGRHPAERPGWWVTGR